MFSLRTPGTSLVLIIQNREARQFPVSQRLNGSATSKDVSKTSVPTVTGGPCLF